jgi:hypothetical protein
MGSKTKSNSSILFGGICIIVLAALLGSFIGETHLQWWAVPGAIVVSVWVAVAINRKNGRRRR